MDPALVRETLLDYAVRTLWAAVVVVIAIVIARAVMLTPISFNDQPRFKAREIGDVRADRDLVAEV